MVRWWCAAPGRASAGLVLLVAACTAGGNGEEAAFGPADSVVVTPSVVLGSDTDPDHLFGEVSSVAGDSGGRTFVGDRIAGTVRAYDADGRFIGQIAGPGEGPGEIAGWAADILPGPDGRLYVRDAVRITVFAPRTPGGVPDDPVELWPLPGFGNLLSTRSGLGADGHYYYPVQSLPRDGHPRHDYIPFVDGRARDFRVEVPPYPGLALSRDAVLRLDQGGGRILEGLSHVPFAPLPAWDLTPEGTILSSDGSSPWLVETDMVGDTIRTIGLPWLQPQSVPPAERADSLQALEARLTGLPVPLSQVEGVGPGVVEREIPTLLPTLIGLHVADDGTIWIERWPPAGGANRVFDALSHRGDRLQTVTFEAPMARDPPPYFADGIAIGVIRDPVTGVDRVARFDLEEFDRGG